MAGGVSRRLSADEVRCTTAHGARASYQAGCRCLRCRVANASYDPTPLVDAAPAKTHLKALYRSGVGYDRAAQLSGLARSLLGRIRRGETTMIRQATLTAILAIPPRPALGARISGVEARRKVRQLLLERVTKARIAREALGRQTPRLQLGPKAVLVATHLRMRRYHRLLMTVEDEC